MSEMLDKANKYLSIIQKRGERGLPVERIFRGLRQVELFMMAYMNIYYNKGAMTPGVDKDDTIDGMSIERFETIIDSLKEGTFKWKPVRRVYIPKANGKKRPLGVPGSTDRLVQEAMRLILSAYYEPQFHNSSHGFRPKRGCHSALWEIKATWRGTVWFIEGDIKGCFDNINHDILLKLIGEKVADERFMKLLRDMLAVGYMEDWKYFRTFSGTPQGGIISPLLANIYLDRLDQYMEQELLPKWNYGKKRQPNPAYRRVESRLYYLRCKGKTKRLTEDEIQEIKDLSHELRTLPSQDPYDPNYRRLRYVRYADDFLLGFLGTRSEAREIKQAIADFLKEQLQLEMSDEKTLITHARTKKAHFLGYDVGIIHANDKLTNGQRRANGNIAFLVPPKVVHNRVAKYTRNGKYIHRAELLFNNDFDIVMLYESELMGVVNYYCMAQNVYVLNRVKSACMSSLLKTLAAKHKKRVAQIARQYKTKDNDLTGIRLTIKTNGKTLTANFGFNPIRYTPKPKWLEDNILENKVWNNRVELAQRLTANKCELCETTDGSFEVHHVKHMKSLPRKNPPQWVVTMIALNRKTLVVCKECHEQIHRGRYDGKKLS